jgi:hypothetical protein
VTAERSLRRRLAWAVYRRLITALEPTIRGAVDNGLFNYLGRFSGTHAAVADYATLYVDEGDLTRYEMRVFSQNGEDGVIAELARRVEAPRTFIDIGAGDGGESNCIALSSLLGWSGCFVEGDPTTTAHLRAAAPALGEDVRVVELVVTPDNINDVVDDEVGLVSIDVDGNDYWLWKALTCRPAIVVIEYNASRAVDEVFVSPLRAPLSWDNSSNFGASLRAFEQLAEEKGYRLVYTDVTGVNAFFVRADLFEKAAVTRIPRRRANYFFLRRGHPDEPSAST